MKPRLGRVLVLAAACAIGKPGLHAQAGLSGSALDGQYEEMRGIQKFDKGFQSKSALGQLEELTGTTVDRSSSSQPQPVQHHAPKPHFNANQAFQAELAGALVGMLFEAVFSDDSAKRKAQAEAEAAQAAALAAAQAEALRVQQELARKARIRAAQHYRADWDARQADTDRQLGGVFDVVSTGTAFFGEGNRVDPEVLAMIDGDAPESVNGGSGGESYPDAGDPSVVDLRGSSLVARPPRGTMREPAGLRSGRDQHGLLAASDDDVPNARESESSKQLKALVDYFGPVLGDWYWETVIKGTAKATLWGAFKHVPGQEVAKAFYDFNEQREGLTDDLRESYDTLLEHALGDSGSLVRGLASPAGGRGGTVDEYWSGLAQRAGKARTEFYRLAIGQGFGKAELDLGETGLMGGDAD